MKHLRRFEGFEYHGPQYAKQICDLWNVDLEDIEDLFIDFADEGKVLIHPMIVNKELQVTIHSIWKDLSDSDWLDNPLWDERMVGITRRLKGMGLDMNLEIKNFPQRFVSFRIFPKTDVITESFLDFHLDQISQKEYWNIRDKGRVVDLGLDFVKTFKSNLDSDWKSSYGPSKIGVEFFTIEWEKPAPGFEVSGIVKINKRISFTKRKVGDDEPIYTLSYFYENWKDQFVPGAKDIEHESVQRKFYFRFEEEDFRHMCNNPQILLDYINSLDLS